MTGIQGMLLEDSRAQRSVTVSIEDLRLIEVALERATVYYLQKAWTTTYRHERDGYMELYRDCEELRKRCIRARGRP